MLLEKVLPLILIASLVLCQISAGGLDANVIDKWDSSFNIKNLTLSIEHLCTNITQVKAPECSSFSNFACRYNSGLDNYENILIKQGESRLTIPFKNIDKIEFNLKDNIPLASITTIDGKMITGENLRIDCWYFRGDTPSGIFCLSSNDTKEIVFNRGPSEDNLWNRVRGPLGFPGPSVPGSGFAESIGKAEQTSNTSAKNSDNTTSRLITNGNISNK